MQAVPDDSIVRELLGGRAGRTKIRLLVQARRPQRASGGVVKDSSYGQIPGHARIVEVRTLREFRRLWAAVDALIDGEAWRDVRRTPAAHELPAAGAPVVDDRS